jgi:hypothetical protein
MHGHNYITVRLRAEATKQETHPAMRSLLNEAASVISGRDTALDGATAFRLLRGIVQHWDEFGHEHGLEDKMDTARRLISTSTTG